MKLVRHVTAVVAGALAILGPVVPASATEAQPQAPHSSPQAQHVVFHALGAPADPLYKYQWDLQPRGTANPGAADWQPAWEANATGNGVVVAVIDSGVTPNPELKNVLPGWNALDGSTNTNDDNGHGTHVAGTVAQATNDGEGTAGVATNARILPVKVLDASGNGSDVAIINGINWAVAHGAGVINLSLGGGSDGGTCAAVSAATAKGVTVVVASGNDGGPVSYPAACPGAIAVGATTISGDVASYSNRGPELALVAPGGDNKTDLNADGYPDGILQYTNMPGKGWGYYFVSGTSMASPHVAGAAALIKEAQPGATPDQVKSILTSTATDKGAPGRDDLYGAGLLDIGAAVAMAKQGVPARTPTAPTTQATGPTTPVDRVAGSSRYGTAAAIGADGWPGTASTVYLASGNSFADALATGALTKQHEGPLLLADRCSLPTDTVAALQRLQPQTVTIVGGPAAVCDDVANQARSLTNATVTRLAGVDRYATSVQLSQAGWAQGSKVVYLASGTNFADALGGAAQAARANAPLLLTDGATLAPAVQAEIQRLGATDVRVLGGATAVSDGVLGLLRTVATTVTRIAGVDRYATAAQGVGGNWTTADTVFLASGATFPDGLAVGPLAAKSDAPLLLVPSCDVPQSVADALRALHPQKLVVVGGSAAVCDAVLQKMGMAAAGQ